MFLMRQMGVFTLLAAATAAPTPRNGQDHAPLPDSLIAAHTIYLINDSGDLKAYDAFYKELAKWGRFKVVTSRQESDVVAVLTTTSTYALTTGTATATTAGGITTATGTAVSIPNEKLYLKIFERQTAETLWSDSTDKWVTSGHAPAKLIDNLKKRMPKSGQ